MPNFFNKEADILNKLKEQEREQEEINNKNKLFLDTVGQARDQFLDGNPSKTSFMDSMETLGFAQTPAPFISDEQKALVESQRNTSPNTEEDTIIEESENEDSEDSDDSSSNPELDLLKKQLEILRSNKFDRDKFEQDFQDQLTQARDENKTNIDEARNIDRRVALLNALNQSANQLNQAFANRSGTTDIKAQAINISSDEAKQAEKDANSKLQDIMGRYKIKSEEDARNFRDHQAETAMQYKIAQLEMKNEAEKRKSNGEQPMTFEEKEELKDKIKQRSENRKEINKAQDAIEEAKLQLQQIKKLKKEMEKSKVVMGPGIGVISELTPEGNKLNASIRALNLKTMTKMFEGMSRAIDSDAERKFFEQSVPSLGNYKDSNIKIIDDQIKAIESMIDKSNKFVNAYDSKGDLVQDISDISPKLREEKEMEQSELRSQFSHGQEVERNGKTYMYNSNVGKFQLKK